MPNGEIGGKSPPCCPQLKVVVLDGGLRLLHQDSLHFDSQLPQFSVARIDPVRVSVARFGPDRPALRLPAAPVQVPPALWPASAQIGPVQVTLARFGKVRVSLARIGPVRSGSVLTGSVRVGLSRFGSVLVSLAWSGSAWPGSARSGPGGLPSDPVSVPRARGGVHADGLTVTAPVLMWVKALDRLLDRLKGAGLDLSRVRALSGSGQQHGSVFWRHGAARTLSQLDLEQSLHQQLQVSLGTSDTVFLWVHDLRPSLEGHVFCSPVDLQAYMALLCFKNGSLTRERIRDRCAGGSWEIFSAALRATTPGMTPHDHPMPPMDLVPGFYFDSMEITPPAVGVYRFSPEDSEVSGWGPEVEVRALVEGQFLSRRQNHKTLQDPPSRTQQNQQNPVEPWTVVSVAGSRVLATGGASSNQEILQVLSDVFNAPVYTIDVSNSTCLGSAYRALHGLLAESGVSFSEVVKNAPPPQLAATPNAAAKQVYDRMLERFSWLEDRLLQRCSAAGQ
ncbi:xylulose kinase-like [Menidia menidia]